MNRFGTMLTLSALLAGTLPATAETFRWTDPASGRVILSNQPPPAGIKARAADLPEVANGEAELPFALREPVKNFPVTLFTATNCKEPCDNARGLLRTRGTPHKERVVDAQEVLDDLKKASGDEAIPTLMIGGQAARGFDARAWNNLLDLAGYPQTPTPGYRMPPANGTAAAAPAR